MDQYKTAMRTSRGVARTDVAFLARENTSLRVRSAASPRENVTRDVARPTTVRSWKYHPKESE
jgi:hypothetical protein